MTWIITKYLLTAGVVVFISEVAKRSDKLGGFIAALPLITLLTLTWLFIENQSEEKIATNILASRLLSLEENGIIKKLNHPESKAKVLYRLTDKGIDLLPIIAEMNLWAEKYYPVPEERKAMLELIHKDKEAFVKTGMERLREA